LGSQHSDLQSEEKQIWMERKDISLAVQVRNNRNRNIFYVFYK
jgi:hypothetical protein